MWKLVIAAAAVLVPVQARAQFTAVVTPPPAQAEAPASEATRARVDSADRAQLTDLRTWVDSAASAVASAPPAAAASDSGITAAAAPAQAAAPAPAPRQTTEFRDGARAPDTATPLPLLLAVGLLLVSGGLFLLRRPRPVSARRSASPRA